jgi:antitoxin MazE
MKISIVDVGDARGVRLPRAVLEQCGIGDEAELTVEGGRLVLSRPAARREGWEAAFAAATETGDAPPLLNEDAPTEWDRTEWRW